MQTAATVPSALAVALAWVLIATAFLLGSGGTAQAATGSRGLFAHAALASTEPADGSVVRTEPQQVSASFDEAVRAGANSLVVYAPDGQRADGGDTLHPSSFEIAVGLLPGLGDGTYTALWHVISDDTHPVGGVFTFSIGAPSTTHVGALLPPSDPVPGDIFAVVRWLEYVFFALLGGGVAFLIGCWPEGAARPGGGPGRLITASALGLLLCTLAGLLLQGPYGAGTGLSQLFNGPLVNTTLHTALGPASEAREVMALLAAGFASFLLPRLPAASRRARRAAGAAWAVLVTGIAASWAVYDHAATGVQAGWGIPDDIIHLDAVAVWAGGLAMLGGFALRGADSGPASGAAERSVRRFSAVALCCVLAIVASGAYQTWRGTGGWGALFDTSYGRLILGKIAGLLVLILLGYAARRYIQRGIGPASSPGPAMRRLRRAVALELAVAGVILALTAMLVNTGTGREAYPRPLKAGFPSYPAISGR
jgi:copper transport protein